MADFSALKTAIQANIRTNGNEEITGAILQEILLSMVSTMGDGAINALAEALAAEVAARQNAVSGEATTRAEADSQLSGRINAEAQTRGEADTQLTNSITAITTRLNEGYVYAGIATPSTNPGTPAGKVFYIALQAGTYTNFSSFAVTQGITILKYNGTAWSQEQLVAIDDVPIPGSDNLVKSGGVYDATLGRLYESGFHYFSDNGEIADFNMWFRVSRLMVVEKNVSILKATSPNPHAPCCVLYGKDGETVIGTIVATTPSTQSGSYVKDISYNDIKNAVYFRWCCDERYQSEVDGTLSMAELDSYYNKETDYSFMNSASIIAGGQNAKYLEISTRGSLVTVDDESKMQGFVKINGAIFVLTDKHDVTTTVATQTVDVLFPLSLELYVAYVAKDLTLKVATWNNFDFEDALIVLCRFTTQLSDALEHDYIYDCVRLDYARCQVKVNGVFKELNNIGVDLSNVRYYDSNGNSDWKFFTTGGVVTNFTSCFKISKYFKVEESVSVLSATSPSVSAPCCVVYDKDFNVIKTIIASTASPFSGTFIKDIAYSDISDGAYFRWCCDVRYPAVVNSKLHEADEPIPELDSADLMESELGGTDISYFECFGYNNYHEAQEMEVYGMRVRLNGAVDTKVLLFNAINHSYREIYTIKAAAYNNTNYTYIRFPKPVHVKPNQYIGFDKNVRYRGNSGNSYKGSFFTNDQSVWVRNVNAVFAYGLYVRQIKEHQISKTISVMTDSIGTDNYVTKPSRNYWRSLVSHTGMEVYATSCIGATSIMAGIRTNTAFVDQSRWGSLFSEGDTGLTPDIILIQGGINDFGTGPEDGAVFIKYAEIGTMADAPSPTTSFYSAYKYLLKNLMETYVGAQIICCTPPKMFASDRLSSTQPLTNKHGLKLSQFVDAIKEVAAEYGAQVVDIFSEMPTNADNYSLYMADTFHPKDEGCAVMERIILERLLEIM